MTTFAGLDTPFPLFILPTRQKQATEGLEFELVTWFVIKGAKE
jgi:hypothetical protein